MPKYKYPIKWNIPELEEARQKVLEQEERVLKSLKDLEEFTRNIGKRCCHSCDREMPNNTTKCGYCGAITPIIMQKAESGL